MTCNMQCAAVVKCMCCECIVLLLVWLKVCMGNPVTSVGVGLEMEYMSELGLCTLSAEDLSSFRVCKSD